MSEKLCLQWNDFQENIKGAFGNFRDDENFNDVSLVCEDGQQVEAASSPFFLKLLGRNKHPHPLIFMRGVKFDDLLAILNFLYRGEANVFQENLGLFLAFAEDLQLRGLMGKPDEKVEDRDPGEEHLLPKLLPTYNTQIGLSEAKKQKRGNKIARAEGNTTVAL